MHDWLVDQVDADTMRLIVYGVVGILLLIISFLSFLFFRRNHSDLSYNLEQGAGQRLSVVDAAPVGEQRSLILVRRDHVEHLILLGGPTDLMIESNIPVRDKAERPSSSSTDLDSPLPPKELLSPQRTEATEAQSLKSQRDQSVSTIEKKSTPEEKTSYLATSFPGRRTENRTEELYKQFLNPPSELGFSSSDQDSVSYQNNSNTVEAVEEYLSDQATHFQSNLTDDRVSAMVAKKRDNPFYQENGADRISSQDLEQQAPMQKAHPNHHQPHNPIRKAAEPPLSHLPDDYLRTEYGAQTAHTMSSNVLQSNRSSEEEVTARLVQPNERNTHFAPQRQDRAAYSKPAPAMHPSNRSIQETQSPRSFTEPDPRSSAPSKFRNTLRQDTMTSQRKMPGNEFDKILQEELTRAPTHDNQYGNRFHRNSDLHDSSQNPMSQGSSSVLDKKYPSR